MQDRVKIDNAISATDALQISPLAMLAFAPHFIWRHQFRYSCTTKKGWVLIFAEYADGIFMPLPPLRAGNPKNSSGLLAAYRDILQIGFEFMIERNQGNTVSRIENIPEELKAPCEDAGLQLSRKDPDYLYRTEELISLQGDRYKSQRAACNQLLRSQDVRIREYVYSDRDTCLALFDQWAGQKEQSKPPGVSGDEQWLSRVMREDARHAHKEVLAHAKSLGLRGRVAQVGEQVCGYTFGYPRGLKVFCILVEITDRKIAGLAPYLFRDMCLACSNYEFINTMDDSGLSSLAHAKRAYHPCRLVPNYIATLGS